MHSLGRYRESAAANSVHDQDEPVDHFTSLRLSLNLRAGAPALKCINAPGLVEGWLMDARNRASGCGCTSRQRPCRVNWLSEVEASLFR
jgi:hypothetical protein